MEKIKLTNQELKYLKEFVSKGERKARQINRARILIFTNEGMTEEDISNTLHICRATVSNIKKKYRKGGLENALYDDPRSGQPKKYDLIDEAEIIALACTDPPVGHDRWTVRLLTTTMKKRKGLEDINRESVRLILKKTTQNHG
jgi:putative transposase